MIGTLRSCLILMAAAVSGAAHAQSAPRPPAGHCYEIVPAQGDAQPAILLDRCRGRTWQLVRTQPHAAGDNAGGFQYRWTALGRDEAAKVRRVASTRRVGAPKAANADRRKCFTFDGRTFCE
jgi:hypothetical protein